MKTLVRFIYGLAVALVSVSLAPAQELDPTFAPVSVFQTGSVTSTAEQPDGKLLVAGSFTRLNGRAVTGLARLNADGTLDQTFNAELQSTISKVRLLPNGQILATGGKIRIGNRSFNSVVKLNADGTPDDNFTVGTGATGYIATVVVQPNGKILLGGDFVGFNGTTVNNLVRLNIDGSIDQPFTTSLGSKLVNGTVRALVVQPDGKIVVGGSFSYTTNPKQHNLFRLNNDGTPDTGFEAVLPIGPFAEEVTVAALALDPQTNYLIVKKIAVESPLSRLTTTGEPDPYFIQERFSTGNTSGDESVTIDAEGRIILSGSFRLANWRVSRTYLARFFANGGLDVSFAPQLLNAPVNNTQVLADGSLLVAGSFSRYGEAETSSLLKLDSNARLKTDFRPVIDQAGAILSSAQQPDGKLLLAGFFREINGIRADNIARVQLDGTVDATFNPIGTNGRIDKIAVQPTGQITVAGGFTQADNQSALYVARLTAEGRLDKTFTTNASVLNGSSAYVQALAVAPDGSVLIGCVGPRFGGEYADLYRLLPTGAVDEKYVANTKYNLRGTILSIALLPDGRHYVGGAFDPDVTDPPATAIVRLNVDGTRDETFFSTGVDRNFRYARQILVLSDNKILIGGNFPSYNGVARSRLARLNPDGSVDETFDATSNGYINGDYVNNLAVQADGRILVNTLNNIRNVSAKGTLYRLLPNGELDKVFSDFNSYTSSVTNMLLQRDGRLLVAGFFTEVGGQPRAGIARLTSSSVLAVSSKQPAATLEAWPNPVTDQLHLRLDKAARPGRVALLDLTGKTIYTTAATGAEMQLPVRQLAAGVYLLRVEYAAGPVTRRVVVE